MKKPAITDGFLIFLEISIWILKLLWRKENHLLNQSSLGYLR